VTLLSGLILGLISGSDLEDDEEDDRSDIPAEEVQDLVEDCRAFVYRRWFFCFFWRVCVLRSIHSIDCVVCLGCLRQAGAWIGGQLCVRRSAVFGLASNCARRPNRLRFGRRSNAVVCFDDSYCTLELKHFSAASAWIRDEADDVQRTRKAVLLQRRRATGEDREADGHELSADGANAADGNTRRCVLFGDHGLGADR